MFPKNNIFILGKIRTFLVFLTFNLYFFFIVLISGAYGMQGQLRISKILLPGKIMASGLDLKAGHQRSIKSLCLYFQACSSLQITLFQMLTWGFYFPMDDFSINFSLLYSVILGKLFNLSLFLFLIHNLQTVSTQDIFCIRCLQQCLLHN